MSKKRRSSFFNLLLLCFICLALVGLKRTSSLKDMLSTVLSFRQGQETVSSSIIDISSVSELADPGSSLFPEEQEDTKPLDDCYTYYYQQLSDAEQQLYVRLYNCVAAREDSITLDTTDTDTLYRVYHFVTYDHPELFWCVGSSQSNVYTDKLEFMPDYSCTPEEITQRTTEIEAAATACLSELAADASDYEKVKYIYTWLVNTVDYDPDASDNQNIYSSLVGNASVCAGYARGMQYLLNRLSIPCIYVTGTLAQGGTHAWNILQCNGTWYQTDATFGDPVFTDSEKTTQDNLTYAYLCCTDAQLAGSHIPDDEVTFPTCTSMDLNYYYLNDCFIWEYDHDALTELAANAVFDGKDGFTLQCANSSVYSQVCQDLLDNVIPAVSQTYLEAHNLKQVRYQYTKDSDMLIFTLEWVTE